MPTKPKPPPSQKVIERKLGRHQALGLCHADGKVEIDARLEGVSRLAITVHELIHRHQPYLDEDEVERLGEEIGKDLWESGWRQIRA